MKVAAALLATLVASASAFAPSSVGKIERTRRSRDGSDRVAKNRC